MSAGKKRVSFTSVFHCPGCQMPRLCLVVDDEPAVRGVVGAVLDGEFQVLEAENAGQAMSIIENLAGGLDLVITDVVMPGEMNGIDLALAVRQAYPGIPVMLTSGYADQQVVQGLPVCRLSVKWRGSALR